MPYDTFGDARENSLSRRRNELQIQRLTKVREEEKRRAQQTTQQRAKRETAEADQERQQDHDSWRQEKVEELEALLRSRAAAVAQIGEASRAVEQMPPERQRGVDPESARNAVARAEAAMRVVGERRRTEKGAAAAAQSQRAAVRATENERAAKVRA